MFSTNRKKEIQNKIKELRDKFTSAEDAYKVIRKMGYSDSDVSEALSGLISDIAGSSDKNLMITVIHAMVSSNSNDEMNERLNDLSISKDKIAKMVEKVKKGIEEKNPEIMDIARKSMSIKYGLNSVSNHMRVGDYEGESVSLDEYLKSKNLQFLCAKCGYNIGLCDHHAVSCPECEFPIPKSYVLFSMTQNEGLPKKVIIESMHILGTFTKEQLDTLKDW